MNIFLAPAITMTWFLCYQIVITIASFDQDCEIYQMYWVSKCLVFVFWPLLLAYYIASFIGNLLGKAYHWSK